MYERILRVREIVANLERQHIRVYTHGSKSQDDETCGYGIRIIISENGKERKLLDYAAGLGDASISEAELTAVHNALRWYVYKNKYNYPIQIFTDSQYTYGAVTAPHPRKKHFYIVEEIQNYAHQIQCRASASAALENTSVGRRFTGNYYADKLANEGRKRSHPSDSAKFIHTVREKILNLAIQLVNNIEKQIDKIENPDGPSANVDDVRVSNNTDASRDSSERGIS